MISLWNSTGSDCCPFILCELYRRPLRPELLFGNGNCGNYDYHLSFSKINDVFHCKNKKYAAQICELEPEELLLVNCMLHVLRLKNRSCSICPLLHIEFVTYNECIAKVVKCPIDNWNADT